MNFFTPSRAHLFVLFFLVFSFLFSFQSQAQAQCNTTVDWQLTPLPSPDNQDWNVTDTVNICVEVHEEFWSDNLSGVSMSLPIGWELISAESDEDCGDGEWIFVENPPLFWLASLGPGYYYDSYPDGNPFNNWGSSECSTVTFCFQVRMVELFAQELNAPNNNSNFATTVVGDSWIILGWSGPNCDLEEVTHYLDLDIPPLFNGQEVTGQFELNPAYCTPSSVEIQLLEMGTEVVAETQVVSVNADGTFSAFIDSYGQYDIRLKGERILANKVMAVSLNGGTTSLEAIPLFPGDVNGDNQVNVVDISNLSSGFGLEEGDFYFNSSFDLNCDGNVNVVDISSLSVSFGMEGE